MKKVLFILVKFVYSLFSWINSNASRTNIFYCIRNKIFSLWMSQRFNCRKCSFGYPISFRCGSQFFKIADGCTFGKHSIITAWETYREYKYTPSVTIGNNCVFGNYLHLTCCNKIVIGKNLLTGKWVTISDNSHGQIDEETMKYPPTERPLYSKGPIVIGDNVWIGDKVTILAGVEIGDNSIIGANSVVTKSIPANVIAAGIPARIIKQIV